MYAKLNAPYAFRGWKDCAWAVVNTVKGGTQALNAEGARLAEYLDGEIDLDIVLLSPGQKKMLEEAVGQGIISYTKDPSPVEDWQRHRKTENFFLRSVHWAITNGCNLACKHCYMSAPHPRYADMTTAQCLAVVKQFSEANVAGVSISGGDPFTRKDIWQIFDALRAEHIAVSAVFTNGLLVDDEVFAAMGERDAAFTFYISFDGLGRHEWLRGPGTEEKTIAVIKRILEKGYGVYVETAVHSGNIDVFLDTYEFLKNLKVDGWKVSAMYESGEWVENKTPPLPLEKRLNLYLQTIDRYQKDGQPMFLQLDGFYLALKNGPRDIPYTGQRKSGETPNLNPMNWPSCAATRVNPNLLPDGRLIPCPSMNGSPVEREMPKLPETSLAEVYSQPEGNFLKLVNRTGREIVNMNDECKTCEHHAECRGGCRAISILNGNGVTGRDMTACRFFKEGWRERVRELAGV
jgi:radical SAM protein with 4Fe4S-binding SPASM domain